MNKLRVFLSFDFDNDRALKDFLIGQAKLDDSPFELSDWSIKQEIQGNWKEVARQKIRNVDLVLVICGQHTGSASGVSAELSIAQEEGIRYVLLEGYSSRVCVKPKSAKPGDQMYKWTWSNLKILLSPQGAKA
jgi:hypothetical protein